MPNSPNNTQIAAALAAARWPLAKGGQAESIRRAGGRATAAVLAAAADLTAARNAKRAAREAATKATSRAAKHGLGLAVWAARVPDLQNIIDARQDLRREARRIAMGDASGNPPVVVRASVVTRSGRQLLPTALGSGFHFRWRAAWPRATASYIHSDRRVAVPAGWLALRLLREAVTGPVTRLLRQPHWIDRIAAGRTVAGYHLGRLPTYAPARAAVERRALEIRALRISRSRRSVVTAALPRDVRIRYRGVPLVASIRPSERPGYRVRWYAITGHDKAGNEYRYGPERTRRKAALGALMIRRRPVSGLPNAVVYHRYPSGTWQAELLALGLSKGARTRNEAVAELRAAAAGREATIPDPSQPDTLGWRLWRWQGGALISPQQGAVWPEDGVLDAAASWSDAAAIRGVAGIHARRLPRDWRRADWRHDPELGGSVPAHGIMIAGIVERWGRAVIGTEGWRAERAVIKAVLAPSTEIGLAIEAAYPSIEVYYQEGDKP